MVSEVLAQEKEIKDICIGQREVSLCQSAEGVSLYKRSPKNPTTLRPHKYIQQSISIQYFAGFLYVNGKHTEKRNWGNNPI